MALNLPYSNEEFLRIVKLAEGVSNRNLLDNGYFVDPINQRGQTEYNQAGYTIDRWKLPVAHSVKLVSNGLKITCNSSAGANYALQQILPSVEVGETYTLSALIAENNTSSGVNLRYGSSASATMKSTGLISHTFVASEVLTQSGGGVGFQFNNRTEDDGGYFIVLAIKLELGEHSTLKNDAPPSKAEELAKCQRFFQRYRTQSLRPTYADDCRPVMRAEPTVGTITADGTTYYTLSADL